MIPFGRSKRCPVRSSAGTTPDRQRPLACLMGLVLLGYLATLVLPGDEFSAVVDVWLPILAQWLPAAICWMVVYRSRSRPWEIVFSAAALSAVATGSTYFYLTLGLTGSLPPFPSPADLGYLSFTPLMLVAVVVSAHKYLPGRGGSVRLDSALGSLAAASVLGRVSLVERGSGPMLAG